MKTKSTLSLFLIALTLIVLPSFLNAPRASKFKVDSKASTLAWTGKKVTGEHTGLITVSNGELILEDKTIKQGSFDIDLTSIAVTDITDADKNAKLVGHLKSDDFFGVAAFPKATFVISSVTAKSGDEYSIQGKLTIKGKTNEIEFPAVIKNDGKQLTALAKITVDRSKYDIRYGSKSFFENLGDKVIYDDFELNLKLVANLQTGV